MQVYSRMRIEAILEVRRHRCRQWKCTDHSVASVTDRYTKTGLNGH